MIIIIVKNSQYLDQNIRSRYLQNRNFFKIKQYKYFFSIWKQYPRSYMITFVNELCGL